MDLDKCIINIWASQVVLVVKNLPASAADVRDVGLIPGSGRSPGGRHGNPLQDSCLENPVDRGAGWTTVHGAAKCQTRLKQLSTHIHNDVYLSLQHRTEYCHCPKNPLCSAYLCFPPIISVTPPPTTLCIYRFACFGVFL